MCGIIAVVSTRAVINHPLFNRARDTMTHRGPDAEGAVFLQNGLVALGHRRLAIMDLSKAANQPMNHGPLWVTYNGEIYNYPALRKELERLGIHFKTNSDTEVLLHGYRVWGKDLCKHLTGMFAFAIWDNEHQTLFLGRDHLGQKPLYYAEFDGKFVIASEIKAIRMLMATNPKIRKEALLDHIIYDFVPEPYTWYENIKCVLPGHQLTVKAQGDRVELKEEPYWTYTPPATPLSMTTEEALEIMGDEIEKAVKSHLMADVEVGAFLSGGTDSSCVVALANHYMNHPIRTFSVGFGSSDEDELPLARETARRVGAIHTEGIVNESEFGSSLDDVLKMFDQPFADSSLVPMLKVAEIASKSVKVVLTGDGGDEAFGGYNLGAYISPALNKNIWRNASLSRSSARALLIHLYERVIFRMFGAAYWSARKQSPRYLSSTSRQRNLFGKELADCLQHYDHRWVYEKNKDSALDPFRQAQWHNIKFILPGKMLAKVDRCAMHHSLEARSPFLSHTLIETMLNMPTSVRNPNNDWYKGLFRQWARNKIPANVINAPKRGFGAPSQWKPVTNGSFGIETLNHCVDASFVQPDAWPEIKRKPRLFWKLLQVERALETGVI